MSGIIGADRGDFWGPVYTGRAWSDDCRILRILLGYAGTNVNSQKWWHRFVRQVKRMVRAVQNVHEILDSFQSIISYSQYYLLTWKNH